MDYKKNLPVLVGLALFAVGGFLGWYSPSVNVSVPSAQVPASSPLGAGDSTTVSNPWIFSDTVDLSGDVDLGADVQIGTSGTEMSRVNFGTCYIKAYAATIAATSTVGVDCQGTAAVDASGASALTGVSFNDQVAVTLSTTTAGTTVNGLSITAASASTTAGYIALRVYNGTGATFTWPVTGSATGTASYIVVDN